MSVHSLCVRSPIYRPWVVHLARSRTGGTPSPGTRTWGYPTLGTLSGVPHLRYHPCQVRPDWGGTPARAVPQVRYIDAVLDTPRSVFLLRSRMRTFFLNRNSLHIFFKAHWKSRNLGVQSGPGNRFKVYPVLSHWQDVDSTSQVAGGTRSAVLWPGGGYPRTSREVFQSQPGGTAVACRGLRLARRWCLLQFSQWGTFLLESGKFTGTFFWVPALTGNQPGKAF